MVTTLMSMRRAASSFGPAMGKATVADKREIRWRRAAPAWRPWPWACPSQARESARHEETGSVRLGGEERGDPVGRIAGIGADDVLGRNTGSSTRIRYSANSALLAGSDCVQDRVAPGQCLRSVLADSREIGGTVREVLLAQHVEQGGQRALASPTSLNAS